MSVENEIKTKLGEITDKIESGQLNRDLDETGADGFWDYSKKLVNERGLLVAEEEMSKAERVYNALWILYEAKE